MSVHRFYLPRLDANDRIQFGDTEAHHAIRVLRIKLGEPVELFDGLGWVVRGSVCELTKREVTVDVHSRTFEPCDNDQRLHFAVALPKGDRQKNTIEKLVELGVDSLTPLSTEYSVAEITENNVERVARYGVEACKQCGRNRCMTLRDTLNFEQFTQLVATPKELPHAYWVLHPPMDFAAEHKVWSLAEAQKEMGLSRPAKLWFAVGPEGGFSEKEVRLLVSAGAKHLSLGARILRVETAVSVAASLGEQWLAMGS